MIHARDSLDANTLAFIVDTYLVFFILP